MKLSEFELKFPEYIDLSSKSYKNEKYAQYFLAAILRGAGLQMNTYYRDWNFLSAYGLNSDFDSAIVFHKGFGVLISLRLKIDKLSRYRLTFSPCIGIIERKIETSLMKLLNKNRCDTPPMLFEFEVEHFLPEPYRGYSTWELSHDKNVRIYSFRLAYFVECYCLDAMFDLSSNEKDIKEILSLPSVLPKQEDIYRVALYYKHRCKDKLMQQYAEQQLDILAKQPSQEEFYRYKNFVESLRKTSLSELLSGVPYEFL